MMSGARNIQRKRDADVLIEESLDALDELRDFARRWGNSRVAASEQLVFERRHLLLQDPPGMVRVQRKAVRLQTSSITKCEELLNNHSLVDHLYSTDREHRLADWSDTTNGYISLLGNSRRGRASIPRALIVRLTDCLPGECTQSESRHSLSRFDAQLIVDASHARCAFGCSQYGFVLGPGVHGSGDGDAPVLHVQMNATDFAFGAPFQSGSNCASDVRRCDGTRRDHLDGIDDAANPSQVANRLLRIFTLSEVIHLAFQGHPAIRNRGCDTRVRHEDAPFQGTSNRLGDFGIAMAKRRLRSY